MRRATQTRPTCRASSRPSIADFAAPAIQMLIASRDWRQLSAFDRIGAAYGFVKDEIRFGYNRSDDLSATEVLRDGYGQCNTKGNLLVALLRGLAVPARVRGFYIDKALQRGAIPEWLYPFTPPTDPPQLGRGPLRRCVASSRRSGSSTIPTRSTRRRAPTSGEDDASPIASSCATP